MYSFQISKINQPDDKTKVRRSFHSPKRPAEKISPIIQLHQTIGNRAVARMLQAKLSIGQPGDKYEQEADRVARQVVNMADSPGQQAVQRMASEEEDVRTKPADIQLQGPEEKEEELMTKPADIQLQEVPEEKPEEEEEIMTKPADIQLQEAPEEEPEEEEEVRTKPQSNSDKMAAGPGVEAGIQRAKGSGQPLANNVSASMGQAFGADFSGVRVHSDTQSDKLNNSLNARAFTTGKDIFFRQGEYDPGSSRGKELLAHELTHVVQQNGRK